MLSLTLATAIGAALAWASSYLAWWAPLIVFPVVLLFAYYQFHAPMPESPYRAIIDFAFMLQQIGWIIVAAIISYRGFGAWWGAILGIIFGILGCGLMAPHRWGEEVRRER